MASLTLTDIPDDLKDRIQELANRKHRSLSQQAILLLERAVSEESMDFERVYRRFRETHGASPLEKGDLQELRSEGEGRPVDL